MTLADYKLSNPVYLTLPEWIDEWGEQNEVEGKVFSTAEERMKLVHSLANRHVDEDTGGPFAAAVFNLEDGSLLSVGVNRVVNINCSLAHAEMMALAAAQKRVGSYSLGLKGMPAYELVTSSQPCAMCFGAIPWSGCVSVVCGTSGRDVERIVGFDEGPLGWFWEARLRMRGIKVQTNLLREQSCEVLRRYAEANRTVYNAGGEAV